MSWKTCTPITVTVKGDVASILKSVKEEAKKEGVDFKGDVKRGSFINSAKDVKGTYTVLGQKITLKTQENMWIGTCEMVAKKVREWFKGK